MTYPFALINFLLDDFHLNTYFYSKLNNSKYFFLRSSKEIVSSFMKFIPVFILVVNLLLNGVTKEKLNITGIGLRLNAFWNILILIKKILQPINNDND